jgi:DNA-binding transcriptional regulator GbsR (MarR family)
MQEMLINLYKMMFNLSKESNARQIDNIKELFKQYTEMVLISPVREQLEDTQRQLGDTQKQLEDAQRQLEDAQRQLDTSN